MQIPGIQLGLVLLAAAMLVVLSACTTLDPSPPVLNPAPKTLFQIHGRKDADLAVHFRIIHITQQDNCLEQRPVLGGAVVRSQIDTMSFAAGSREFTAEFMLDKHLPGACQWYPRNIEVAVSRGSNRASSWQSLVWIGGVIGTPGLAQIAVVCRPATPGGAVLSCDGPIASVAQIPGSIDATFVVDPN